MASTVKIVLSNKDMEIWYADKKTLRAIEQATSYLTAGYRYSGAFKAHVWDGREKLLEYRNAECWALPIGMLGEVTRMLTDTGREYELKRVKQPIAEFIDYRWNEEIVLRPYQLDSVAAFLSKPNRGRGILKLPIRSGKTVTAAKIIHELKVRTLFMVPSQMLLNQTIESFKNALPGARIGKIGDGGWEPGDITVATVQSLLAAKGGKEKICKGNRFSDEDCICRREVCKGGRRYLTPENPKYSKFMSESHDLVIFDEAHHAKGQQWRGVLMDSNARYRLGLSATIFFNLKQEIETGVIWIKSATGDIKHTVDVSDLIDQGYLMKQNVKLYKVDKPKELEEMTSWTPAVYTLGIYGNEYRNQLIVTLTEKFLSEGFKNVMLSTNRLEQVRQLDAMLDVARIDHGIITGSTPKEMRQELIAKFKSGEFKVLLGTVFGEGIDIPECECVINAEGGKDAKKTIQRMRSMTIMEGKTRSLMVDFYDCFNKFTKKHSNARIKVYKEERAFLVEKMW